MPRPTPGGTMQTLFIFAEEASSSFLGIHTWMLFLVGLGLLLLGGILRFVNRNMASNSSIALGIGFVLCVVGGAVSIVLAALHSL